MSDYCSHVYDLDDDCTEPAVSMQPPFSDSAIIVDACLSEVMQHLWDNGVITLGCVCRHDGSRPMILLQDCASKFDAARCRQLVKQIDDRDFEFLTWQLMRI